MARRSQLEVDAEPAKTEKKSWPATWKIWSEFTPPLHCSGTALVDAEKEYRDQYCLSVKTKLHSELIQGSFDGSYVTATA